MILPFWYLITQVVLEKRPLNGCSSNVMLDGAYGADGASVYSRWYVCSSRNGIGYAVGCGVIW